MDKLTPPIIGLAPMDGVTDAAYRWMLDTYSQPDVILTEFTSVEGVSHGAVSLLNAFIYHPTQTPTIAQIYGSDPASFYKASILACEMGFDGIDINMGCPDKSVTKKGAGAALINSPQLAQTIVKTVRQAIKDWVDGKKLTDVIDAKLVLQFVERFVSQIQPPKKRIIPVSVKTRIGFDEIVTERWITQLLEVEPTVITVHGRTLKQMYSGFANWEEIGKAARLARSTRTKLLGNGDIKSMSEAHQKIQQFGTDGVLVGRATFGNPWFFRQYTPSAKERLLAAIDHCAAFARFTPHGHFPSMRKHLAWYCRGFDRAAEIRIQLMQVNNLTDVKKILEPLIKIM